MPALPAWSISTPFTCGASTGSSRYHPSAAYLLAKECPIYVLLHQQANCQKSFMLKASILLQYRLNVPLANSDQW
eukprot:scaffold675642_cov76-Prasinocladus_malaysianus.AAC.1